MQQHQLHLKFKYSSNVVFPFYSSLILSVSSYHCCCLLRLNLRFTELIWHLKCFNFKNAKLEIENLLCISIQCFSCIFKLSRTSVGANTTSTNCRTLQAFIENDKIIMFSFFSQQEIWNKMRIKYCVKGRRHFYWFRIDTKHMAELWLDQWLLCIWCYKHIRDFVLLQLNIERIINSDNGMLQIFRFLIEWLWSCLNCSPHIHAYLFIFANTEIYVK